eukprot:NODE_380_length_2319_cov_37.385949_g271_i1.p1 GENE.NODE_380_length_2319_cov_37.385949_g271_i1~~NODE_380_length_2319_cov_37.385949_g271_i1.p1  ORF type:complete len:572 (-),score=178.14 NODE_380_length_2319_cov_37.385949_g271_i1:23-1738(-)
MCCDLMFKHIRTDTVWDNIRQCRGEDLDIVFGHKSKFFNKKKNKEMTFAQYMREQYHIVDSDLDKPQPLLESISRKERDSEGKPKVSYYIPSLCHLTGQTQAMKEDKRRSRMLIDRTALAPNVRLQKIAANMLAVVQNPQYKQQMDPWGLVITPKLIQAPARLLHSPVMRNGQGPIQVRSGRETWDVKFNWPMFRAAGLLNWGLLTHTQSEPLKQFVDRFMTQVAREIGLEMRPPTIYLTASVRTDDYIKCYQQKMKGKHEFVMVLVRRQDEPYKRLKRVLCAEDGVPSQFVNEATIAQDALSKANKIVVQMNCKAGGAPWTADLKLPVPTMIVGIDVHHGGDLEHKGGTVAGYVASLDRHCTRFFSRTFVMKEKQQTLDKQGLHTTTKGALQAFQQANSIPPQCLVVYRDGGSEGELQVLLKAEAGELLAVLKELKLECKLVYIVVLKQIRTRFFAFAPNNQDVITPAPGTLVDSHVVSGVLPEFYLCCQHVNKGTATPTKYQKIFDNSLFSANQIATLTYTLSHLYFNWYGTVRVPCVLKYASTLAKFCGDTLRGKEAHPKLHGCLHYL